MPSNEELINSKVEELRGQLEVWATDTLKLPAGHRVSVTVGISIERSSVVDIKVLTGRKGVVVSTQLQESDWETILALPLTDSQRLIVEYFKREGNPKQRRRDLNGKFPEGLDPFRERWNIEAKMLERGLRYRFKKWPGRDEVAKIQFAITT